MSERPSTRRTLALTALGAAGVGLTTLVSSRVAEAQTGGMGESWVHGTAGFFERSNWGPSKGDAFAALRGREGWEGDYAQVSTWGAMMISRFGWGNRYTIFDTGGADNPQSGAIWVHYAVPVPAMTAGRRPRLTRLIINHETTDFQRIAIRNAHVRDGGNAIVFQDNIPQMAPRFELPLNGHVLQTAVGVSLLISANNSKGHHVTIFAIGVQYEI